MLMRLHSVDPISQYNFAISKIEGGASRHLKKKNKKLQYLHNTLTSFDQIWSGDACHPTGLWQPIKFCEFKNPRCRPPFESRKIAISLLWMDQYPENLAW